MTKDELVGKFQEIYGGAEGVSGFFAPGRVNLIGEHTDYNGGHVDVYKRQVQISGRQADFSRTLQHELIQHAGKKFKIRTVVQCMQRLMCLFNGQS